MSDSAPIAARVRSGLEETLHHGAVAVSSADGSLVAFAGDIDRPFFLRSSAKPFQAFISQELGARLSLLELAVASASHAGHPVHIGLVESLLAEADLSVDDLRCPPSWPLDPGASLRLAGAGESVPRRIWHNCSGKHAGFLRACAAGGLPTDSYLSADHPLQRRIIDFVSDLGGYRVDPVGVDGCGAPVLRTTARAMSLLFARLGGDRSLREVFVAMHRYPALVGGNGEADSLIATATNGVAKRGALGCVGVSLERRLGIAVKSWDGLGDVASLAAVSALDQLGELTATARSAMSSVARPDVLGGGVPVGATEPRLTLELG